MVEDFSFCMVLSFKLCTAVFAQYTRQYVNFSEQLNKVITNYYNFSCLNRFTYNRSNFTRPLYTKHFGAYFHFHNTKITTSEHHLNYPTLLKVLFKIFYLVKSREIDIVVSENGDLTPNYRVLIYFIKQNQSWYILMPNNLGG